MEGYLGVQRRHLGYVTVALLQCQLEAQLERERRLEAQLASILHEVARRDVLPMVPGNTDEEGSELKQQVSMESAAMGQVSGETDWAPMTAVQEPAAAASSACVVTMRVDCRTVSTRSRLEEAALLQLDTHLAGSHGGVRVCVGDEYCLDEVHSTSEYCKGFDPCNAGEEFDHEGRYPRTGADEATQPSDEREQYAVCLVRRVFQTMCAQRPRRLYCSSHFLTRAGRNVLQQSARVKLRRLAVRLYRARQTRPVKKAAKTVAWVSRWMGTNPILSQSTT